MKLILFFIILACGIAALVCGVQHNWDAGTYFLLLNVVFRMNVVEEGRPL